MSVYEKLLNVQNELKAPKSQFNAFGKYHYRSAEDIVEAAKPLCVKHRLLLTLSDSVEQVGDRIYIKSSAKVVYIDEPTAEVTVSALAREPREKKGMDDSQITGTASSYARKYALNGLFDIDDTKDSDDLNNGEDKKPSPKKPAKPAASTPPPAKLDEIKCPKCGKRILSASDKNGVMRNPAEILRMCGGMCIDCMKLQKNAGANPSN